MITTAKLPVISNLVSELFLSIFCLFLQITNAGAAWLAQLVEGETLDLRVVSSILALGVKPT